MNHDQQNGEIIKRHRCFFRAGSANEEFGGSVHQGSHLINHPNYAETARFNNDVSVIKVSRQFRALGQFHFK
ncbi:hypothetical protein PR048_000634 [Dryococelus australis]|uniref:Uncharacterized protein n=1 Tax=Dryococelus australis TaxID=614101 RepID=A0ABQ9IF65_9NEOP|nr:hypothetical protein PR048_000634 [Dryococelus australis]